MRLTQWKNRILDSPGWRTFISIFTTIGTGIASGAFITEITTVNGLNWASSFYKPSFYILIVMGILIYVFQRALYIREIEIEKFRDIDYCRAYIRAKCLPAVANMYEDKIRSGDIGEFEKAMEEVNKVLK
jgi:hypothetical protein